MKVFHHHRQIAQHPGAHFTTDAGGRLVILERNRRGELIPTGDVYEPGDWHAAGYGVQCGGLPEDNASCPTCCAVESESDGDS